MRWVKVWLLGCLGEVRLGVGSRPRNVGLRLLSLVGDSRGRRVRVRSATGVGRRPVNLQTAILLMTSFVIGHSGVGGEALTRIVLLADHIVSLKVGHG